MWYVILIQSFSVLLLDSSLMWSRDVVAVSVTIECPFHLLTYVFQRLGCSGLTPPYGHECQLSTVATASTRG